MHVQLDLMSMKTIGLSFFFLFLLCSFLVFVLFYFVLFVMLYVILALGLC